MFFSNNDGRDLLPSERRPHLLLPVLVIADITCGLLSCFNKETRSPHWGRKKHLWIVVNKETRSPLIEDTKWSIYGLLWYFNKEMKSPHWENKRIQLWIVVMFQQRDEDTKDFNSCLLQRSSSVFPSSPLLGILNRMRALYLQHHKCIFRLCCFGNFQLFPGLTSAVGWKIERGFIVGRTGKENVSDEERCEP